MRAPSAPRSDRHREHKNEDEFRGAVQGGMAVIREPRSNRLAAADGQTGNSPAVRAGEVAVNPSRKAGGMRSLHLRPVLMTAGNRLSNQQAGRAVQGIGSVASQACPHEPTPKEATWKQTIGVIRGGGSAPALLRSRGPCGCGGHEESAFSWRAPVR